MNNQLSSLNIMMMLNEFNSLGIYQGVVLKYAPYLKVVVAKYSVF